MPLPWVVLPSLPLLLVIVPPLLLPPTDVFDPSPTTFKPPLEPVVSRMIPLLEPPFDEMLWNSRLFKPIVVFATFSAVPVVDVSVLTTKPVADGLHGLSSQT